MEKKPLEFLTRLLDSFGPSGFERDALRTVKEYVEGFSDAVSQDKLGSLLFEAHGSADKPVILLPGHVDEVGFLVTGINDKGYLSFTQLGGWFDQVLLTQRVIVRTRKGDREGVIAAKPPHLLDPDERNKVVVKEKMFIDLGCSNKREAEELGVRVGDPVVPASRFSVLEKEAFEKKNGKETSLGTVELGLGKAFDDRIGAFVAAEVVRRLKQDKIAHANRVVGAATVQEEVGLRGAATAGWLAEPDVVLTLEVDIAGDVPGVEPHQAQSAVGKGPTIVTFDASMIPNQALKDLVIATAEEHKIPYQLTSLARGGTDGGAIHKLRSGCPGIVIGVPTRHLHSHVGILSLGDVESCILLLLELVKKLDRTAVEGLTRI
jgi:putative aminopeptidase FrvX